MLYTFTLAVNETTVTTLGLANAVFSLKSTLNIVKCFVLPEVSSYRQFRYLKKTQNSSQGQGYIY